MEQGVHLVPVYCPTHISTGGWQVPELWLYASSKTNKQTNKKNECSSVEQSSLLYTIGPCWLFTLNMEVCTM